MSEVVIFLLEQNQTGLMGILQLVGLSDISLCAIERIMNDFRSQNMAVVVFV